MLLALPVKTPPTRSNSCPPQVHTSHLTPHPASSLRPQTHTRCMVECVHQGTVHRLGHQPRRYPSSFAFSCTAVQLYGPLRCTASSDLPTSSDPLAAPRLPVPPQTHSGGQQPPISQHGVSVLPRRLALFLAFSAHPSASIHAHHDRQLSLHSSICNTARPYSLPTPSVHHPSTSQRTIS